MRRIQQIGDGQEPDYEFQGSRQPAAWHELAANGFRHGVPSGRVDSRCLAGPAAVVLPRWVRYRTLAHAAKTVVDSGPGKLQNQLCAASATWDDKLAAGRYRPMRRSSVGGMSCE